MCIDIEQDLLIDDPSLLVYKAVPGGVRCHTFIATGPFEGIYGHQTLGSFEPDFPGRLMEKTASC